MLGTMTYENEYEDWVINNKLLAAYQKAYNSYQAASDRYDKLVSAYRVLKGISTGKAVEDGSSEPNEPLPYTEKIIKQMIEDAHNEKNVIADHARECIRHLRSLKYKM